MRHGSRTIGIVKAAWGSPESWIVFSKAAWYRASDDVHLRFGEAAVSRPLGLSPELKYRQLVRISRLKPAVHLLSSLSDIS